MSETLNNINEAERGGLIDLGKALRKLLAGIGGEPAPPGSVQGGWAYHDTAAALLLLNPVMDAGESGYESDTFRWKLGDGTLSWDDLPYQDTFLTPPIIENPGALVSFPFHPFATQTVEYTDIPVSTTFISVLDIPTNQPPITHEGFMFVRIINTSLGSLDFRVTNFNIFGEVFDGLLAPSEIVEFSMWVLAGDWYVEGGPADTGAGVWTGAPLANADLALVATNTIKGRLTGGTGVVEDLTVAQVRAQVLSVGSVVNATLADVATGTIRGRLTAGTGDVEDLTVAQVKEQILTAGSTTNAILADVATGTIKGRLTAGTGAVEDLTVLQVKNQVLTTNSVTNALLDNVATGTIKGRITAATGAVEDLTTAQVKGMIDNVAPLILALSSPTTLVKATHQGKTLVCNGAISLTVNASTDFDDYAQCIVWARGGIVTLVATATINTASSLIMPQHSVGILQRDTTADVYVFNWMGRPSDMAKISTEANNVFNGNIWVGLTANKGSTAGNLYFTTD